MSEPSFEVNIGDKYGPFTILEGFYRKKINGYSWRFVKIKCVCEQEYEIKWSRLKKIKGDTCQCKKLFRNIPVDFHGLTKTRAYQSWKAMKARCYNPNDTHYKYYGAKGTTVCDRWKNSFRAFFEDMGECPEDHSIHKKDNNGHYCLENCCWATDETQANCKTNNHLITIWGETKTMAMWAKDTRCKVTYSCVKSRIKRGIEPQLAMIKSHGKKRYITAWGETKSISEWSRDPRCKVDRRKLNWRIKSGKNPEEAMTIIKYNVNGEILED